MGFDTIYTLATYFFTLLAVLLFHGLVVYGVLLRALTPLSPVCFEVRCARSGHLRFRRHRRALPAANASHRGKKLGVNKSVCGFSVPLGATINMDGTAIMQGWRPSLLPRHRVSISR